MAVFPAYVRFEDTPGFDDEESGLKLALTGGRLQGEYPRDGEWPLFGACRVERAVLEEFQDAPLAHVHVVVCHKETGEIRVRPVLADGMRPGERPGLDETGGELLAVTVFFAIDLKRQCGLSPVPGRYWVHVLLGPLVSPSVRLDIR